LENGGGIGRQMGYFLRALEANDASLSYLVVDSRGPWFLGASPLHSCLAVIYLAVAALRLLVARVSHTRCIVHVNITGRGSTIRKALLVSFARLIGLNYLLHVHDANYGAEYRRCGTLMRLVIRSIFSRALKVLVLGERDREQLSRLLRLPHDHVTVLHNAVPDPQPLVSRPQREDGSCHLLFLGHLSERKGVSDLLHALASTALVSKRWHATLAGGGPIDEYRRLAATLGVADRTDFTGWVDQTRVSALCAEADILVLPSHAEGLAMAVLEGLSHGMAVVTTPVGAHEEVIEGEVSGLLVPPGDWQALAHALLRLVEDGELRRRLSTGARRQFLEKFDVRVYAERLSHLHARLLSGRRKAGLVGAEQIS
jgi:glycosyltransferase involved in cell wall biosynthesis